MACVTITISHNWGQGHVICTELFCGTDVCYYFANTFGLVDK